MIRPGRLVALLAALLAGGAGTARAEVVGGTSPDSFSVCESEMDATGRPRPECQGGDVRFQLEGSFPSGSEFGFAIAAGHLNGDDRVDLVVGDPRRNRVYIFFGRVSTLFSYGLDPNDLSDRMASAEIQADLILTREPPFPGQVRSFGFSVAVSAQRVTAAGCAPAGTASALLIGAPGRPGTTGNGPGTVFHLPAGALCQPISDPPAPLVADPIDLGGQAFQSPEGGPDDEFGFSVAFGRLLTNTGSDPDVVVGARGSGGGAGGVFILPVAAGLVDLAVQSRVRIDGATGDGLGEAMAVGDLDGDFDPNTLPSGALDDLVAGAVGHESGKVLVVQGPLAPTDGRDGDGILREGIDPQVRSIVGEMPGDYFGFSVDVGAQGDLAVGAIFADNDPPSQQQPLGGDPLTNVASGSRFNAGKVYVWEADVVGAIGTDTPANTADLVFVARRSGDQLGFGVAYGDFDGSGTDDLAIAARREDGSGLRVDEIDQGTVYVVYDTTGPTSPVDLNRCDVASDCTGVSSLDVLVFGGDRAGGLGDEMGFSLASGNFNADTSTDIFVSSVNHGRVYAISLDDTDADRETRGRNIRDDDDDNDSEPDLTDCAPVTSTVRPGAMEIACNGIDENCNGMGDDAPDADGDGFDVCNDPSPGDKDNKPADCADGDPASFPGALEVCDGNDNDCSGGVPAVELDADGDLFAGCAPWVDTQGDNPTILGGGDCDRTDPATFPGAAPNEMNPGACMRDRDGDDFGDAVPPVGVTAGTDCDDTSPGAVVTFPGAAPLESMPGACRKDADGDDFGDVAVPPGVTRGNDCNDADSGTHPGATEACDGNDNDCSGSALPEEIDSDGDHWVTCTPWADSQGDNASILGGGDCAPVEAGAFPGAAPNETLPAACMMDADGDDYGAQSPPPGVTAGTDCDDSQAAAFPGAAEIEAPLNCMKDADEDGWGDDAAVLPVVSGTDCDDGADQAFPGALESPDDGIDQDCSGTDSVTCFVDVDGDGFGSTATTVSSDGSCADPGESPTGDDCNDADLGISPGATETPNDGVDQDCNGADAAMCFLDADQDGHGGSAATAVIAPDGTCDAPDGESVTSDDCDDADAATHPGAAEVCDGNDNDCAGGVPTAEMDGDGDGYASCAPWSDTQADNPGIAGGADCDPASNVTFPGAAPLETFAGACMRDEDGDDYGDQTPPAGVTRGTDCDDDSPAAAVTFPGAAQIEAPLNCMRDADDDGYGDAAAALPVVRGTDCDDARSISHPGAAEICDGNSNVCAASPPADETDPDGDGFVACTGWSDVQGDQPAIAGGDDCDPNDSAAFPGASPNEAVPSACTQDEDGDGFGDQAPPPGVTAGTDCDDDSSFAAATFPGAAQIEAPLNCMKDLDDDGFGDATAVLPVVPGTDCDDDDPASQPGAAEVCDGNDNACTGAVPAGETDGDVDGFVPCLGWVDTQGDNPSILGGGDCDDGSGTAFPGAPETCGDMIDSDCDGQDPVCLLQPPSRENVWPRRPKRLKGVGPGKIQRGDPAGPSAMSAPATGGACPAPAVRAQGLAGPALAASPSSIPGHAAEESSAWCAAPGCAGARGTPAADPSSPGSECARRRPPPLGPLAALRGPGLPREAPA